jgi:hypothetical protein
MMKKTREMGANVQMAQKAFDLHTSDICHNISIETSQSHDGGLPLLTKL